MAYTSVPTVSTGDLWTASDHNTYIKDNFAAGVPAIMTAKGDLAVGSGSQAASRLAVGADYNILMALASEALGLKWVALDQILQIGYVSFFSTDTTSTDWVDVGGSSLSMTLNTTSTLIAIASGVGKRSSGNTLYLRLNIDNTIGNEVILESSAAISLDVPMSIVGRKTNVSSGARTIKLQYKSSAGGQVNFYNGCLLGLAIPSV